MFLLLLFSSGGVVNYIIGEHELVCGAKMTWWILIPPPPNSTTNQQQAKVIVTQWKIMGINSRPLNYTPTLLISPCEISLLQRSMTTQLLIKVAIALL